MDIGRYWVTSKHSFSTMQFFIGPSVFGKPRTSMNLLLQVWNIDKLALSMFLALEIGSWMGILHEVVQWEEFPRFVWKLPEVSSLFLQTLNCKIVRVEITATMRGKLPFET